MLYIKPQNIEVNRNYNLVIGYFHGKAIIKNEFDVLFFIEGEECHFPEGTIVETELLNPIKLLPLEEQKEIMSIYMGES